MGKISKNQNCVSKIFAKRNLFVYNIHDFNGIDSGLTAKSFKGVHYG